MHARYEHLDTFYICCVIDVYLAVILVFPSILCVYTMYSGVYTEFEIFFGSCYYYPWRIFSFTTGKNVSAGDTHRYPRRIG